MVTEETLKKTDLNEHTAKKSSVLQQESSRMEFALSTHLPPTAQLYHRSPSFVVYVHPLLDASTKEVQAETLILVCWTAVVNLVYSYNKRLPALSNSML